MIDNGNATTIGHRRWILSNSLGPIGLGGTDRASCMWTLGGSGRAGKTWMAWPAAGDDSAAGDHPSRGSSVDSTGWTIQSDNINLAGAQVTVTIDGAAQPVTVTQLVGQLRLALRDSLQPDGLVHAGGQDLRRRGDQRRDADQLHRRSGRLPLSYGVANGRASSSTARAPMWHA